jgi:RNA polymerase sigma-70 factor (ECF subfamily)
VNAGAARIGDQAVTDDALMARLAMRDGQAFRLVVDRHAVMVRRLGYRMLGDIVEAEDVAQEALARLWEHAARWRPGGPGIGAWLHRVAVNACLDRLRKRRFVGEDAAPERVDTAPLADAAIESDQLRDAVVRCVAALADRQRAAIVLTYYEGLSNIMAADALEMNIKAFESLLHRARRTLEESLRRTGIVDAGGETLA